METLLRDFSYSLRMLRKNPGFTAVTVLVLALGVGANTAIFSVVSGILLRPLLYADPNRLVMVWHKGVEAIGGDHTPLCVADLLDWRAQQSLFEHVGALTGARFLNYTGGEVPERVISVGVTANFFTLLGTSPLLGRTFLPYEENPGTPRAVVISHRFWLKYLSGDPKVINRTITLDGTSYTVVGVMTADFDFPSREVESWTAMQIEPPARRGPYYLRGLGKLKRGITLEPARAEMRVIKQRIQGNKFDPNYGFNVVALEEVIVGQVRPALIVLLAAVTVVLLIAAGNVANLLLVRAAAREKEISIRAALGANRRRLMRQLLTESMLLCLIGGTLGLLLAAWGIDALLALAPADLPRLQNIGIDWHVLGWTALISFLTGIVCGVAPALQNWRLNLNESLKEGGRSTTESAGKRRLRGALVVAEVALALSLLVVSGLLIKSFWHLRQVNSGVNTERVLTMQLAPRYSDRAQLDDFYRRLLEQVKALPGVEAAAVGNSLPPDQLQWSDDFLVDGHPVDPNSPQASDAIRCSPEYFRVLGVSLRRGRYFNETDTPNAQPVAIINDALARQFFPNEDAVGKRIRWNGPPAHNPWMQIVGVVSDVKYRGLKAEVQPGLYQPAAQNTPWEVHLIVKTATADPLNLVAAVRNEVRALDRNLPVVQISTLEQRFSQSVAQPRFGASLLTLFALIALILASVGIYGVISYSVTQRTHEVGVRMALGAQTWDVLRLIVGQGMVLVVTGVAIGLAATLALARLMTDLFFGVRPTDPATFAVTALLLTGVALLACLLPARRAAKVDPMVALRYE